MVQSSYEQSSFMSGEWSQTMQGRSDHTEYRKALNVCFNGVITETEAWTRRPGTIMAGTTKLGKPARVVKFELEESFPYNMEFTDGFLRFWSGASRVTANDSQNITGISTSNPVIIQTQLAHKWSTGNTIFFTNLGSGATPLQGRTFVITVIDATHFSIADELTGVSVNGANLTWISGGVANRILEIATPYIAGAWASLRSVQAEQLSVLLNGSQPQILTAVTLPGPNAFASFTLAPSNFQDGPYLDPFPESFATPSAVQGNITLTLSFQPYSATFSYSLGDYVSSAGVNYKSLQAANLNNTPASSPTFWKVVSGGDPIGPGLGFQPSDIGRHVRLFSEPPLWVSGTAYVSGNVVSYNTELGVDIYYQCIQATSTVIPGTNPAFWVLVAGEQYASWSWGRIIAVSGAGVISGLLTGIAYIGNMTQDGGNAAAFNGNTLQGAAQGAAAVTLGSFVNDVYVGVNYIGATGGAEKIAQVVVYPSSDFGFGVGVFSTHTAPFTDPTTNVVLNLWASQTAPTAPNNGTLLGTTGSFANQPFGPRTIVSSDQNTAWNYVWVEIIVTAVNRFNLPIIQTSSYISQVIFYTPNVANGSVATVQIAGVPLLYTSIPIRTWRLGVYSNSTGWPTCGTYHEGRLWFGGAIPNRFDASMADQPFIFSPTQVDGTVTDANGISYVLNTTDVNAIFWMVGKYEGIVCGTQGGEWLIQASSLNQPLTPTSIQAHRYTTLKCANIEPVICEHTMAFVQLHQRRMMEYFADVFSGKFASPNLTYKSQHITAPGIVEIRYQHDLIPVIWMRTADNKLSGVSYKRDSLFSRDGPTISAHHRHQLGSNRTIESITVGPTGVAGQLQSLSMITFDGTYRYVEIMGQVFGEADAVASAQFLDSALVATSYGVGSSGMTINGLWLLNGQTVSVFAAGLDCGTFTVANGSVFVPYGDGVAAGTANGQFTQNFLDSFNGPAPILVGFSYLSQGQILRVNHPQEAGARQGVTAFGKIRRTHRVAALVVNAVSNYLSFGTVFGKMFPAFFRTLNGPIITTPFTGVYKESLKDQDSRYDSMLAWQASGPYPCTVAKVAAYLDTEDE